MVGLANDIITFLMVRKSDGKTYELKEFRRKRTLTQNAYYWVLVGKIADAIHERKSVVHNTLLRDYGQIEMLDGKAIRMPIPDTDAAEHQALCSDTFHIRPTSQVREGKDKTMYRTYVLLRGSSEYNTAEMKYLLDGCIQEAKQQGIETLTPSELEDMRQHEIQLEKKQRLRHTGSSKT